MPWLSTAGKGLYVIIWAKTQWPEPLRSRHLAQRFKTPVEPDATTRKNLRGSRLVALWPTVWPQVGKFGDGFDVYATVGFAV